MTKFGVLSLYIISLVYILFFNGRKERLHTIKRKELINLVPVKNEVAVYKDLNINNPGEVFNYFANLLGNILLFIPYPFLIISVTKTRKSYMILLSALSLSLSIEIFQFILHVGVADIDDVLLNTTGAFIGLLFYKLLIIYHKFKIIKSI